MDVEEFDDPELREIIDSIRDIILVEEGKKTELSFLVARLISRSMWVENERCLTELENIRPIIAWDSSIDHRIQSSIIDTCKQHIDLAPHLEEDDEV